MRDKHAGRPSVDNANLADYLDPGEQPVADGPGACQAVIQADTARRVTVIKTANITANAARREGTIRHEHPSR